jgi:hypothetical protein
MDQKIKLIIKSYEPEEKTIELEEVAPGRKPVPGVKKGMTIKEFKEFVRSKYGDTVEIVNQAKKNRDDFRGKGTPFDPKSKEKDDRYNMKDIRDAMKQDY